MELLERMNRAIGYVEENLGGKIDNDRAASLALCSAYHFHKLFSIMAGVPFGEYVRNRRLDRAAYDLMNGDERVADIAAKYGYDSPTAFNRAFQRMHGVAPSDVRRGSGVKLSAYPPISFQITIRGAVIMEYKIEQVKSFRAVGYCLKTGMKNGEQLQNIPAFWNKLSTDGSFAKIVQICESNDCAGPAQGMLGICMVDAKDPGTLNYYVAAPTESPVPEGMTEVVVPDCTYAVFEARGPMPQAIQELTKRIYTEWLPNSGYEWANAPDIERYLPGDTSSPDYVSQVWLPVAPKSK